MIITCLSCKTQYAVPSEAIPPQGKKVKCSNCGTIWLQAPLEALVDVGVIAPPPPPEPRPLPKHSNLPAAMKAAAPVPLWFKLAFGVCTLLAGCSWALANHAKFPGLEKAIGMENTEGVVFRNFNVIRKRQDNRLQFAVEGDIANESDKPRPLSDVRIQVVTKGGRVMSAVNFHPKTTLLQPGEVLHIQPMIENISGNADKLVLDMGNKWEMLFR